METARESCAQRVRIARRRTVYRPGAIAARREVVFEQRYVREITVGQIARTLKVSRRTIEADLRAIRAGLLAELRGNVLERVAVIAGKYEWLAARALDEVDEAESDHARIAALDSARKSLNRMTALLLATGLLRRIEDADRRDADLDSVQDDEMKAAIQDPKRRRKIVDMVERLVKASASMPV